MEINKRINSRKKDHKLLLESVLERLDGQTELFRFMTGGNLREMKNILRKRESIYRMRNTSNFILDLTGLDVSQFADVLENRWENNIVRFWGHPNYYILIEKQGKEPLTEDELWSTLKTRKFVDYQLFLLFYTLSQDVLLEMSKFIEKFLIKQWWDNEERWTAYTMINAVLLIRDSLNLKPIEIPSEWNGFKPVSKPTYYHPFTQKEMARLNSFTHYPLDFNRKFEERMKIFEDKLQTLDEIPLEIEEFMQTLHKELKHYYLEKARGNEIAPSPLVVGRSGWKNPSKKFSRKEKVLRKAMARLSTKISELDKLIKKYKENKAIEKMLVDFETKLPQVLKMSRTEYANKIGKQYNNKARARREHENIIEYAIEKGYKIPVVAIREYPKLISQNMLEYDFFDIQPPAKRTKTAYRKYIAKIKKAFRRMRIRLNSLRYSDFGLEILQAIREYEAELEPILKPRYLKGYAYDKIQEISEKYLQKARYMEIAYKELHKEERKLKTEMCHADFEVRQYYNEYDKEHQWGIKLEKRLDKEDFYSIKEKISNMGGFWSRKRRKFFLKKDKYATKREAFDAFKLIWKEVIEDE